MENLLENRGLAPLPLSHRVQTIADALIVTTDHCFVLGKMREAGGHNRIEGEYHVPGTGVNDFSEKRFPEALQRYLVAATGLEPELLDVVGVSYREPDNRFVRHIHYRGRVNLTANEAREKAKPGLNLSEVVIVTGCEAVRLIASSKVAFERTPKVFQTMFNARTDDVT